MPDESRPLRLHEIDGIRGWAALAVVAFHTVQEVFGLIAPNLLTPSLRLFMDGPLAVYIFFILSGDALSAAFILTRDLHALDRIIVKRYFRLAIPVLLVVLPTYALMKLGLIFNQQAATLVHHEAWLGSFLLFTPTLWDAVYYALLSVFGMGAMSANYNSFLWTMPIELLGSLFVFSYLHILHRLRWPLLTTLSLIAVASTLTLYYGLFFIGILLAQLRANGVFQRITQWPVGWLAGSTLLLLAYWLEYYTFAYPLPTPDGSLATAVVITFRQQPKPVLAALLVVGIYISAPALYLFRSRLSTFLGRISFGLYLVQFPVICSFESYLIVTHPNRLASQSAVLGFAALSILLTILLATGFTRLDDLALRRVSLAVSKLLAGRPSLKATSITP